MKSWRSALLWAIPLLVVGFFIWQGSFASNVNPGTNNTASTRMTYGRFLEYLDKGRVSSVDLYENGRTAIVEAVDPELRQVQRLRVDLPGASPELIGKLREANVDFDTHPLRSS